MAAYESSSPADLLASLKEWFWLQDGFGDRVFAFAEEHADFFESVRQFFDAGGEEHPLEWTQFHAQFVTQFEAELADFLSSIGWTIEGAQAAMQAAEEAGGADREAHVMVDVMLSIADYRLWLQSMLKLAAERAKEDAEAAERAELAAQGLAANEPSAPLPAVASEAFRLDRDLSHAVDDGDFM
eukprot:TRINITY_DN18667_c0_g1_i1.p1 TRINITY_DN18667_c0_g1~~TRINITY_DN18667_c0_g1_i1.p1  ORF type:complete len:184 (-),score=43.99 TRINITY_DN18667_c0_g1_i1:315-866(-)